MYVIKLKNKQGSLNKIESFVEQICDEFNIGDTFLGNLLITITEVVNIIERQNSDVKISFRNEQKKFTFEFTDFSKKLNLNYFTVDKLTDEYVDTEMGDSLLMINALCDDLMVSKEKRTLTVKFLNSGIDEVVSNHRKEYLNKFLNQRIKV